MGNKRKNVIVAEVCNAWTIEIPSNLIFTTSKDKLANDAYMIHVQEGDQGDFTNVYETDFEFLIQGAVEIKGDSVDLSNFIFVNRIKGEMLKRNMLIQNIFGNSSLPEIIVQDSDVFSMIAPLEECDEVSRFSVSILVNGINTLFEGQIALAGRYPYQDRYEIAKEFMKSIKPFDVV